VSGTRPDTIKLAPVYRSLLADDDLTTLWATSGQHRRMLRQALTSFHIEPDVELPPLRAAGLADAGAQLLRRLDATIADLRPDLIVVQGDTSTSAFAALAAFYAHAPVVHVEAGLRTGDIEAP